MTFLRHVIAFVITVIAAALVSLAAYAFVFAAAAFAGKSIGSPFNFLLVPLLTVVSVSAVTLVFVVPLSLLFTWVCRSWKVSAAIPPALVIVIAVVAIVAREMAAVPTVGTDLSITSQIGAASALVMFVAGPSFLVYWLVLHLSPFPRGTVPSNSP